MHFLSFVNAEDTTGLDLSTVILDKLNKLKTPFEDGRGQAYVNGDNMKGKHQEVQARLFGEKSQSRSPHVEHIH